MGRKKATENVESREEADQKYSLSETTQSNLSTILNSPFGGEMIKPFSRTIFLRHMPVAGILHIDNYDSLLKSLKVDDELLLVREPQNEYDNWAIMVMTKNHEKLGYIPRRENKIPARLMDAGKKLLIYVSSVEDSDRWDPLWIALYMED